MEDLVGSNTSCFVGDFSSRDYETNMSKDTGNIAMHQLSGNTMSIMSNRLSYFFDLNGPSMTVDTACSSSLVALHLACRSIKCGESNMVIRLVPLQSVANIHWGLSSAKFTARWGATCSVQIPSIISS